MRQIAVIALLSLVVGSTVQADPCSTKEIYRHTAKAAAGSTVRLRNINGPIEVVAAAGAEVEVVAIARYKKGDPSKIKIQKAEGGGAMTFCVMWPSTGNASCEADGTYSFNGNIDSKDNDVLVLLQVKLPAGVKLDASSVNGRIEAVASADTRIETVNGHIDASIGGGGGLHATTVNGRVDVRLAGKGNGAIELETVNGRIDVSAPKGFAADVEVETQNGRIDVLGERGEDGEWKGKIGKGGRKLNAATQNGRISITVD